MNFLNKVGTFIIAFMAMMLVACGGSNASKEDLKSEANAFVAYLDAKKAEYPNNLDLTAKVVDYNGSVAVQIDGFVIGNKNDKKLVNASEAKVKGTPDTNMSFVYDHIVILFKDKKDDDVILEIVEGSDSFYMLFADLFDATSDKQAHDVAQITMKAGSVSLGDIIYKKKDGLIYNENTSIDQVDVRATVAGHEGSISMKIDNVAATCDADDLKNIKQELGLNTIAINADVDEKVDISIDHVRYNIHSPIEYIYAFYGVVDPRHYDILGHLIKALKTKKPQDIFNFNQANAKDVLVMFDALTDISLKEHIHIDGVKVRAQSADKKETFYKFEQKKIHSETSLGIKDKNLLLDFDMVFQGLSLEGQEHVLNGQNLFSFDGSIQVIGTDHIRSVLEKWADNNVVINDDMMGLLFLEISAGTDVDIHFESAKIECLDTKIHINGTIKKKKDKQTPSIDITVTIDNLKSVYDALASKGVLDPMSFQIAVSYISNMSGTADTDGSKKHVLRFTMDENSSAPLVNGKPLQF